MGWGTWQGLANVFGLAGEELGPKRTEGQYRREEAERLQAGEARQVAEERRRTQLFPGQLRTQELGIKGQETQNETSDLERRQKTLELAGYPAAQARAQALQEAQIRKEQQLGDKGAFEVAHQQEAFDREGRVSDAEIAAQRASAAASGHAGTKSDIDEQVARQHLEVLKRQSIPVNLAWAEVDDDMTHYSAARASLKNALTVSTALMAPELRQERNLHLEDLKNSIRSERSAIIEKFKRALVRYGGPIKGNHKDYDVLFPDIDYPHADPAAAGGGGGGTAGRVRLPGT